MNKQNYQLLMEQTIQALTRLKKKENTKNTEKNDQTCAEADSRPPRLLLHSCCAPCSTYCIEALSEFFEITVFYYNPNIYPEEEYRKRAAEQKHFIEIFPTRHPVHFLEGDYETGRFYAQSKGLEDEPERGRRCRACFELRLSEAAKAAARIGADFFTTTLTISPLKDAALLNTIGKEAGESCGVPFLPSDFKKKNGYLRSCEISREYGMYRQDYCGCIFSAKERERRKQSNGPA